MKAIDFVKAAFLAVLILVVNVAISFGVVAVYAYAVEPGHDQAFYELAAQWIAPWSSIAFGWVLFLGVCYGAAKRNAERNALTFALCVFAAYAAIDVGLLFAAGMSTSLAPIVALSLTSKAAGAIGGVWMAGR